MKRRLPILLAAFTAVAAIGACNLDESGGLSRTLGDPLLDINLGPAGDAVYPRVVHQINATRDTLTVTLRNLGPLPAGAAYQVFLVDSTSTGTNVTPATGRLIREVRTRRPVNRDLIVTETRADTTASGSAITEADTNYTFTLRVTGASTISAATHVVVGVVPAAQTAASHIDATQRFGFAASRYRTGTSYTTRDSGGFGSWSITSSRRLPFIPSSATINGAFRGNTVRLNVRDLIRPPQGYRYAAWVYDVRTGRAARLGGVETPVPDDRPLDDADVGTDPFLTDVAIIEGQVRGDTASAGNIKWDDFSNIALLLEPKGSAPPTRPGAAFVLSGAVPQSVASRAPGAGKVSGTVTSNSNGAVTNATVFLAMPGSRNPLPGLIGNASATGTFLFRTVAVGQYKAYVIPPGATTPSDSTNVTIGTRQLNGATVGDSVGITLHIP